MWSPKKLRTRLAIPLFIIGVAAAIDLENLLGHHDLDNVFVEGLPEPLRARVVSAWTGYGEPILTFLLGPFGLGLAAGAAIVLAPDIIGYVFRRWRRVPAPSPSNEAEPGQDRRELIARWRAMLAETALAVRQRGADIQTVLLGSPEYLSLEPHLQIRFRYLVRTGTTSHGRKGYPPSDDEAGMSYETLVLFNLNNEITRIEREWTAGG